MNYLTANAPRQLIDIGQKRELSATPGPAGNSLKKPKCILLEIERCFDLILEIEEEFDQEK